MHIYIYILTRNPLRHALCNLNIKMRTCKNNERTRLDFRAEKYPIKLPAFALLFSCFFVHTCQDICHVLLVSVGFTCPRQPTDVNTVPMGKLTTRALNQRVKTA